MFKKKVTKMPKTLNRVGKRPYLVTHKKDAFSKMNISASKFTFSVWVCAVYFVEQNDQVSSSLFIKGFILHIT